jgi:hypothetical protein
MLPRPPLSKNLMSQPHFEGVWGWHSHSRNGDLRVLRDSRKLIAWLQGSKHSPWGVLYTVGRVLKRKCQKWPHMNHSDICSTSYVRKKGQESNWQFDSRPLKVGNRPNPSVCRWSVTHCWKALKENYKFALDFIPIRGLSKELWAAKVLGVQTGTILGLLFGSLGKKCHSDVGATE